MQTRLPFDEATTLPRLPRPRALGARERARVGRELGGRSRRRTWWPCRSLASPSSWSPTTAPFTPSTTSAATAGATRLDGRLVGTLSFDVDEAGSRGSSAQDAQVPPAMRELFSTKHAKGLDNVEMGLHARAPAWRWARSSSTPTAARRRYRSGWATTRAAALVTAAAPAVAAATPCRPPGSWRRTARSTSSRATT